MDLWLEAEVRMRRDDAFAAARTRRIIDKAKSGRSRRFRERIADGAQLASDALASFARILRTN
jgi:hypothetical protein